MIPGDEKSDEHSSEHERRAFAASRYEVLPRYERPLFSISFFFLTFNTNKLAIASCGFPTVD
jgi:hypothetical protein